MKIFISGGDSFTYGAELPDDSYGPSKLSWANLVAEKFKARHVNVASSGRSNSFIARRVIHNLISALEKYHPDEIFVQVMWTFVARREFKLFDGTLNDRMYKVDSEWLSLDPYTTTNEAESEWFKKVDPNTPNYKNTKLSLENKYNLYKEAGIVDLGKAWYTIVSDEDDVYTSLKDILLLQELLSNKNIKYFFTYVSYHNPKQLFDDQANEYTTNIRKLINHDNWFTFPGEWDSPTSTPPDMVPGSYNCKYIGFNDWGLINNYEYATSHPLEKGHSDASELIYEHIKKIL